MRITCVHQGYELYGSDRMFVESIAALRKAYPDATIEAVIPRHGPIEELIGNLAIVRTGGVWVIRKRHLAQLLALSFITLPLSIFHAARSFFRSDIVYINTAVIINYWLVARLFPRKTIGHVHEIPVGRAASVLGWLVRFSKAAVLFNSQASAGHFCLGALRKAYVIHNGYAGPVEASPPSYDGSRPLRIGMLGRINRWKGQDLLIEAISRLPSEARQKLHLRIAGNSFEGATHEDKLRDLVAARNLNDIAEFTGFVADPRPIFAWADVVAVPSRLPEPFGLVAIEAMAHARPVIAAAHGGLLEIVEDGQTGWLFAANDTQALARCLSEAIGNPDAVQARGIAGRARFETSFSADAYQANFAAVFEQISGLKQTAA